MAGEGAAKRKWIKESASRPHTKRSVACRNLEVGAMAPRTTGTTAPSVLPMPVPHHGTPRGGPFALPARQGPLPSPRAPATLRIRTLCTHAPRPPMSGLTIHGMEASDRK